MKRLIIALSVIVLLLAVAVIAPGFVDWNKYKPQIIEQAEKATGLDIQVDGDLSMALLPYPRLSVEKLSIDNPEARSQETLAEADRVSVQVALMPLFKGIIQVTDVTLISPKIRLVIDGDGAPNWMTSRMKSKMGTQGAENDSDAANGGGAAVALDSINIKNGAVSYYDMGSKINQSVSDLNISLSAKDLMGSYRSKGSLVYNGQAVTFDHESGSLDKLGDSLPVTVHLKLPGSGAEMSFSGVVAQKQTIEGQGNIGFKVNHPASLTKLFDVEFPEYLNKAAAVKGFATLTADNLNLRDAELSFAGNSAKGHVLVTNYKPDSAAPMNIDVDLTAGGTITLDHFMPPQATSKGDPAGQNAKMAGFMPESITLPQDLRGVVAARAPSVVFNGKTFQNVTVAIATKENAYDVQLQAAAPGQSNVNVTGQMTFGAKSKAARGKAVTLSEPVIAGTVKLGSQEPEKMITALSKVALADNVKRLLSYNLDSEIKFSVTPVKADAEAGYIKLDDTRVNFTGSMRKGRGDNRDAVNIVAKAVSVDADKWLQRMDKKNAVLPATKKTSDVRAIAAGIAVPFDVVFNVDIQGLRFKGRDYMTLLADGTLKKDDLRIETIRAVSDSHDEFMVSGDVKELSKIGGLDITLKADINDVEKTLTSFDIKNITLPTRVGKAVIISEFKGTPERLAFTANIDALRAATQATGVLSNVLQAPKVSDLTLRLKHPNYVELVQLFQPSFSSGVAIKKNVDVFASMTHEDDIYKFSKLQATFGPTTMTGDVSVTMGTKPHIVAALDLTDLPLDALMGGKSNAARNDARNSTTTAQGARWSRNAIDTLWMHKFNMDVKATAKSFSYGTWSFDNAGINISLKDGALHLTQLDGGFAGGQVALTGNVKSSPQPRQPLAIDGNFIIQNVSLEQFVQSFSGGRKLVEASGDVSLNGKVTSTGLSPAALVFDLNGNATATGSDLIFKGFDLARLSRALNESSSSFSQNFGALLDASMSGGTTAFDTLDGQFTIKEGIVNFDKMNLVGADADVVTKGHVNLPLWTVDLESSVQLKEPEDAPPLIAVFKGSLSNPGKTFGQSAMNQYFQRQLEGLVINPLLERIDEGGALKQILGIGGGGSGQGRAAGQEQSAPAAPATPAVPAPDAVASPQQQTGSQIEPEQQQQQQQQRPMSKEEAIFGVIEGLLGAP